MKKTLKKIKAGLKDNAVYSTPEVERYLGALNEIHGETLKVIREGNIITNRKIDKITETLDEHSKKLDSHSKILDSHTEMIGTLVEDMTIVKEDLSVIKVDLKRKVDYDDFLSLVRRVQKIESKI